MLVAKPSADSRNDACIHDAFHPWHAGRNKFKSLAIHLKFLHLPQHTPSSQITSVFYKRRSVLQKMVVTDSVKSVDSKAEADQEFSLYSGYRIGRKQARHVLLRRA